MGSIKGRRHYISCVNMLHTAICNSQHTCKQSSNVVAGQNYATSSVYRLRACFDLAIYTLHACISLSHRDIPTQCLALPRYCYQVHLSVHSSCTAVSCTCTVAMQCCTNKYIAVESGAYYVRKRLGTKHYHWKPINVVIAITIIHDKNACAFVLYMQCLSHTCIHQVNFSGTYILVRNPPSNLV